MEPAGKLEPQDWMVAPETRAVVAALAAGGREVRFVGGCGGGGDDAGTTQKEPAWP